MILVSKSIPCFWMLSSRNDSSDIEMNGYQGDLTDASAKTKSVLSLKICDSDRHQ